VLGVAVSSSVGTGGGAVPVPVTLIVTDRLTVPDEPVQASVKVVLVVIGPTICVPVVGFVPVQPCPATHEVTLLPFQARVACEPETTLEALAVSVRLGVLGAAPVVPRGTIAQFA